MKYCEQVKNHSKNAYSVMFCCDAAGNMLPPMVIYKSTKAVLYYSWCGGPPGSSTAGPAGATYAATKNGWFNMDKFNLWFKKERVYLLYPIFCRYVHIGTYLPTIPSVSTVPTVPTYLPTVRYLLEFHMIISFFPTYTSVI